MLRILSFWTESTNFNDGTESVEVTGWRVATSNLDVAVGNEKRRKGGSRAGGEVTRIENPRNDVDNNSISEPHFSRVRDTGISR